MSKVITKFQCNSITNYEFSKQASFSAVCSNIGENKDFTKYTPNGELKINIDNETIASTFFQPGKYYYLSFEEAK